MNYDVPCDDKNLDGAMSQANALLKGARVFEKQGEATIEAREPVLVKRQLDFLAFANDYAMCVQRSSVATQAQRDSALELLRSADEPRRTLKLWYDRAVARNCASDASNALDDARAASTLDDAKAAAKRAQDAAANALAKHTESGGDKDVDAAWKEADDRAAAANAEVDSRTSATSSICGADDKGRLRHICGTYGLSAGALSFVAVRTPDGWTTQNHLLSVAVPSAAFRLVIIPQGWLSFDIGLSSAFLTQSLAYGAPSTSKTACTVGANVFENKLPCEANAVVYPYMAGYAGFTAGKSGIGFITIAPITAGMAQVGSDTTLRFYIGFSVGVLQLNGKF
jgi:hypothetical protein